MILAQDAQFAHYANIKPVVPMFYLTKKFDGEYVLNTGLLCRGISFDLRIVAA